MLLLRNIASFGQASSHNPQKIQRNMLISYFAAYFSSRYNPISLGLRSAASMVMASAGQASAHKPHAVQRSAPFSSLLRICTPRHTELKGFFTSGYLMVG